MEKSPYEPPETMYPEDTEKLHFYKHPTIWEAHVVLSEVHTSIRRMIPIVQTIFFEAKSAEEAYHRAKCLLGEGFQMRRLPIATLKETN